MSRRYNPRSPEPARAPIEVPAPVAEQSAPEERPEPKAAAAALGESEAQMQPASELVSTAAVEAPLSAQPAKGRASRLGHTLCRVTGGGFVYEGHLYQDGSVAEFADGDVLTNPALLVSVA